MEDVYRYNFPPNRRSLNDAYGQLKHAAGEIVEAALEDDDILCAIECLDVIECMEGALRALEARNEGCVDVAMECHRDKQRKRGDYGLD